MQTSSEPSPYQAANALYAQLEQHVPASGEMRLPAISLAHIAVPDTRLTACLATLDVPFREPGPFTKDVEIDERGNEGAGGVRLIWWLGDASRSCRASPVDGETEGKLYQTRELFEAWADRMRFAAENPLHPLKSMRDAIDARDWFVQVIQAWRHGRAVLPIEARTNRTYVTKSLHGAAVLRACGWKALAFTGSLFVLERTHGGVEAEDLLQLAARAEGATPAQWMSRVLPNYAHLLDIAKSQSVIIREKFEDQTLLLNADSTRKNSDKFHNLIER